MSEKKTVSVETLNEYKGRSLAQETWRRFLKNKGAIVGMAFMILLVILACSGDLIYDFQVDITGFSADLSESPSLDHLFGTDQLGRDIFARVIYGTRYSLIIGVGSVALGLVVGLITGSLAGQNVNQGPLWQTQDDSSYGTAKAGVLYFTKHFASQVIRYGIRVNSLSPGYCYSPGLHSGFPKEVLDVYDHSQPIDRMMQVEELQAAILFLASDASTYCVGTDLLVDGGHKNW